MTTKDVAKAQRHIDIARSRGIHDADIFTHDLFETSNIFDGDLPAHTDKASLVSELESKIDVSGWNKDSVLNSHVFVDFMSRIRQMPLSQFDSLGPAINAVILSATHVTSNPVSVHVVLDSYIEMSVKEAERIRRSNTTTGIDIIGMQKDTPVPNQLDKFWASDKNKINIQHLTREIIKNDDFGTLQIIASSIICDDEVLPTVSSTEEDVNELNSWIEEADARLILHIDWAVRTQGCKRAVIISNDADTMATILRYMYHFCQHGLKELWQQYGTGEKRRMIPLHNVADKLGFDMSRIIIKAHILTGCDSMSKIGSKKASLACDPVQFLSRFGESSSISEDDETLAEKYLVRVYAGVRSSTKAETFDQLRLACYLSGIGIDTLPPTSSVIRGHIKRGAYLVHQACTLLSNTQTFDSNAMQKYGWSEHLGMLLPTKCLNPLPCELLIVCKCSGRCNTRRCRCRDKKARCTVFCHSKSSEPCVNMSDPV